MTWYSFAFFCKNSLNFVKFLLTYFFMFCVFFMFHVEQNRAEYWNNNKLNHNKIFVSLVCQIYTMKQKYIQYMMGPMFSWIKESKLWVICECLGIKVQIGSSRAGWAVVLSRVWIYGWGGKLQALIKSVTFTARTSNQGEDKFIIALIHQLNCVSDTSDSLTSAASRIV